MADLPQFAWPVAFQSHPNGAVTFAEVEQGTADEHRASAALIAATRRGQRLDDQSFGVSELLFQEGFVDTDRLAGEIRQSDDRLELDAGEVLEVADTMRRTVTVHIP